MSVAGCQDAGAVPLPGPARDGPLVDGATGCEPARLLTDDRARVSGAGRLQGGDDAALGMDELAGQFGGPRADVRVRVGGQVPQRGLQDLVCTRSAGAALAPVAGQSVERGDPDPGVGVVGRGDELTPGNGF